MAGSWGQLSRTIKDKVNKQYIVGDEYAKYISLLASKAKSLVRDLDPTNDLTFLRIKTKGEEIMVTPDKDFILIAIQGPRIQK